MDIWQIILTPFSWLLRTFYEVFNSYGLALILFSLVTKVVLYPLSLKGKRSMIKMNALTAEQQALQRKYGKDPNRLNLEVQKLYQREGVSPYGGCLWSLLPMPLLIGLFTIVRSPISYFMGMSKEAVELLKTAFEGLLGNSTYYEITIAKLLGDPAHMATARAAVGPELADKLMAIDFNFFGIDLSMTPTWKVWEQPLTWAAIGLFLLPVISAALSFFSTRIMNKTNQMNQNSEASAAQNSLMMNLMMPAMSLMFGFMMPGGVSIYWVSNSLFSMIQEIIMGRVLKTEYAAAAERRAIAEAQEKEEEKRRKREQAEERARRIEEEKRSKVRKKEKPVIEGDREASREGLRAYARGRAYEPNRFGGVTPYGGGAPVPVQGKKPASEEAPAAIIPEDEALVDDVDVLTEGEVSDDEMD